jgi:hypothetical protein
MISSVGVTRQVQTHTLGPPCASHMHKVTDWRKKSNRIVERHGARPMTSPIIYILPRFWMNTVHSKQEPDEGCSDDAFLAQCDRAGWDAMRATKYWDPSTLGGTAGWEWILPATDVLETPIRGCPPGYQTYRTSVRGLSYCSSSCCRSPVLWASLRKGGGTTLKRTRGPCKG